MATSAIPSTWGIQAAFTGVPNILMFEAESELNGEDAGKRMNEAVLDYKFQEATRQFQSRFGGRAR